MGFLWYLNRLFCLSQESITYLRQSNKGMVEKTELPEDNHPSSASEFTLESVSSKLPKIKKDSDMGYCVCSVDETLTVNILPL